MNIGDLKSHKIDLNSKQKNKLIIMCKPIREDLMAEILVVTSKVKKFIKDNSGCNTSAETIDVLSKAVEQLCKKGIDSAKNDGRKTVMARDIVIDHI